MFQSIVIGPCPQGARDPLVLHGAHVARAVGASRIIDLAAPAALGGHIARQLRWLERKTGADLVVVPQTSPDAPMPGELAAELLSGGHAAVWQVPSLANTPIRCVLIATDLTPGAEAAVSVGLAVAPRVGAHACVVLHSYWRNETARKCDSCSAATAQHETEEMARLLSRHPAPGVNVIPVVLEGVIPCEVIEQAAERYDADLIVMGSRNRGALSAAVLGSTTREILARARRDVLVVPAAHG